MVPTVAYVFDLDGVLVNNSARLHHLLADEPDHDAYYDPKAMVRDTLIWPGIRLATELSRLGTILVATGRPERTRHITMAQLTITGIPIGHLLMRADGDRRPNHEFKLDVARTLRAPWWDVRLWVDDNPKVAAALEDEGITTLVLAGVGQFHTEGV